MGSTGMRVTRWVVCAGAGQYLDIAGRLVASGCAQGIEWESSAARFLVRLSQLPEGGAGVIVGEGCEGQPALDLACSAAVAGGSALVVLCVRQARRIEGAARDRGVDVCVEPDALLGALAGLRADWAQTAEHAQEACGEAASWDEPTSQLVCGVRPAGRPGRVGVEQLAFGEPAAREAWRADACEKMCAGMREVPDEGAGERGAAKAPADGFALDLDEPWDVVRAGGLGGGPGTGDGVEADGSAPVLADVPGSQGRAPVAGVGSVPADGTPAAPAVPVTPVAPASRVVISPDAGASDDPVPTICLASARGGVGKSTLAVLMALAMAGEGLRVALIDLDYQFGTCLGFLGLEQTDGLPEPRDGQPLSLDERMLERCRVQATPGLLAYEFCRMPELSELFVPVSERIVRAARGRCDVALVDLPAGMSEGVAQVLELSDRCLIVGDQQALSLESMAAAVALSTRLGVPRTKLLAVLNRSDARHRDEGFLSRARFELQTPQIMRVVDGGPEVTRMLELGCAGELVAMRNRCALSSADLASALCTELGCGRPAAASPTARELPVASAPARRHKVRRADLREELVPCL